VEKWHDPNACILQGAISNLALAHHQRTPRPWHSGFSSLRRDAQCLLSDGLLPESSVISASVQRPGSNNPQSSVCASVTSVCSLLLTMTVIDETHINPHRSSDHRRHSLQCPRALLSCNRLVSSLTCLPSFAWLAPPTTTVVRVPPSHVLCVTGKKWRDTRAPTRASDCQY
jgi:hypothetical protein